jgi:hypothetical protein
MTILAEASNESIGSFINVLAVLVGVAGGVGGLVVMFRGKSKVQVEPQPIETRRAPRRYNHDLTEQRFNDHERRLTNIEEWRQGLDDKLERNKTEILESGERSREKLHQRINNQSRMLYLIAGKLGVNVSRDGEEHE